MKRVLFTICFLSSVSIVAQVKYCADSSIRIKYSLNYPNGEIFVNNLDTSGYNIFAGSFNQSAFPLSGITVFKTDWGENVLWSKRFYSPGVAVSCQNIINAPDGSNLLLGIWGSSSDFLLIKVDLNGSVQWSNRYRLTIGHGGFGSGSMNLKNVIITNEGIYFVANFNFLAGVVVKLDLNGNIIWSKKLRKTNFGILYQHNVDAAPVINNDTLLVLHNFSESTNGIIASKYPVITKLNKYDGSMLGSADLKTIPDNTIKAIIPTHFSGNRNNTFALTGTMSIPLPDGQPNPGSHIPFNITLNSDLTALESVYYNSNPSFGFEFTYDYNNSGNHVFLKDEAVNGNNKNFISFDKQNTILRSRRVILPPNGILRTSVRIDNKLNIHFGYNYKQSNRSVIEYARISDLTAANTASCFGEDVLIAQERAFTITREPFTWDTEESNIVSSFPVALVEEPELVTKELVCKQVSYCDSLKIRGTTNFCFPGPPARFSTYLNLQCLKERGWTVDSAYATIVTNEADSAVTLQFKKAGSFYLRAQVKNCVVSDSLLITVNAPQTSLQLTKADSLICPGASINLQVSPNFISYLWHDGSTQPNYTVTAPGLYKVTAVDNCGNSLKDSILIRAGDTTLQIPNIYPICQFDSARVLIPSNIQNISWQPASTGILVANRIIFYPSQTTDYLIKGKRVQGCDVQKMITVRRNDCPEWVQFPSAFTPNNDGVNDAFKPTVSGHLVSYSLKVYDRYGQVVFSSKDPYKGWDGKFKSTLQNSGVFVMLATYRFGSSEEKMKKGIITLIR